jgi:hypothetical protein
MRAGASLHCTRCSGTTYWTLSTGSEVSKHVANLITKRADIVGVGDALLGTEFSQSFHYIEN